MEEKYKKFLQIDWSTNNDWQLYYSNLTPAPPGNKIPYFKKRFYKLKIDPEFDINYEPESEKPKQQPTSQNPKSPTMNNNFVSYYSTSLLGKIFSSIEILLWITAVVLHLTYHQHSLKVSAFVLFFRVFKRIGRPRFNMQYAQVMFMDEHLHILMVHLLLMIDRLNQFCILPFYLTAILNIFDCFRFYSIFKTLSNKIINKRVTLCELRANSEVLIGFILIIGIFFGVNSFLLPIFYWQFLRFKYIFNSDTSLAFGRLNNSINKNKSKLPSPLRFVVNKIQQLCEFLGKTEANPGERAGGSNCLIF